MYFQLGRGIQKGSNVQHTVVIGAGPGGLAAAAALKQRGVDALVLEVCVKAVPVWGR